MEAEATVAEKVAVMADVMAVALVAVMEVVD